MTDKDATPVLKHLAIDVAKDASAVALDCAMTNGSVVRFEVPAEMLNGVMKVLLSAELHIQTARSVAALENMQRTDRGEPPIAPQAAPVLLIQELRCATRTDEICTFDLLTTEGRLLRVTLSGEQSQVLLAALSAPAASELQ
jgi:hypothetical protein